MSRQRFIHPLPIGIERPLVDNFTANGDDVDRLVGAALTNRSNPTLRDYAEIVVVICSIFSGLDIGVTVEPLGRLLKGRELRYHTPSTGSS